MRDLLELNKYFVRYKKLFLWGTFFLILANIFLVWGPVLVRQAIDSVQLITESSENTYSSTFEALFSTESASILAEKTFFLILSVVVYGLLLFLTRQTIIVGSRHIEYDLRNEIYDHLQKLPQDYFARNRQGDVYVRATEDIVRIREYFGPAFMYTINTVSRAGIIIGMMVIVNPELTLWALIPLPFLSVLAYWMSGYIHDRSLLIQEQYANLAGRAQEAFSSIRLIKAFVREDYENQRFEKESQEYKTKKLSRDFVESLFFPMLNLLIGFSIVIVIWKGGLMVMDGSLSVGNIAEFIIDVLYLTWPVASLGYTINLIQRSAASYSRLKSLMKEETVQQKELSADRRKHLEEELKENVPLISFRNVFFRYPTNTEDILSDISIDIPKGAFIGIVGKTGSGKTSLVQLIPRLFDATSGEILIEGTPIESLKLDELRQYIGMVPQDVFLFSNTIKDNILFGAEDVGMNEVENAAKKAQVLDNILEFEKKFDTILGERGITLSGGQKQRTSIARALIRQPDILILDDSLSAVDIGTEEAILNELKALKNETTVILISHRISTVKSADNIFVLDNGRISETGSHNELLQNKGTYYSMYEKQLIEDELLEL